jgi:hypothetical protein
MKYNSNISIEFRFKYGYDINEFLNNLHLVLDIKVVCYIFQLIFIHFFNKINYN